MYEKVLRSFERDWSDMPDKTMIMLYYLLLVVPGENSDGVVKERSRELAERPVDETK